MLQRIVMVRHGQTYLNAQMLHGVDGRYAMRPELLQPVAGREFDDLNAVGFQQAERLAAALARFEIGACLSSPLRRTRETVEPLLARSPALRAATTFTPDLIEKRGPTSSTFAGAEAPKTVQEWVQLYERARDRWVAAGHDARDFRVNDEETQRESEARLSRVLNSLPAAPTILLVAHQGINECLLTMLSGVCKTYQQDNCCINVFYLDQDRTPVKHDDWVLNDLSHLSD